MADDLVRCPYCVLGNHFRPMAPRSEGLFICEKCGHITSEVPGVKCTCRKCSELNRAA